ncbi:hypothetical protein IPV08_22970 [Methylobacterium sp. SD274]|uniref:hypothetical protein n=1 Tax=Methylobacterium sp. SD274 TaxID=2782009 RepID=UPI001A965941|nr:hypothetical protein [Methylobacterium sp. SD274]MBO1022825.1 hypothetical protein [Methylobacterium sp. SD274]
MRQALPKLPNLEKVQGKATIRVTPESPVEAFPVPTPVHDTPVAKKRLSAPPSPKEAPTNLHLFSEGFVDLNFKVQPELRHAFKVYAASKGMTGKELLESAFELYTRVFPLGDEAVEIRRPSAEQMRLRREKRQEREARMTRIRSHQG